MAIVVTELSTRDGEVDINSRIAFTRVFEAHTDNRRTYQKTVLLAVIAQTGVNIGDKWEIGSPAETENIYCTRLAIQEQPEGMGQSWKVTAYYEPVDPARLGLASVPEDPADAPISVSHGEWTEQEQLLFDKDGKVLINSAGDVLLTDETHELTYPLITIVRNERVFNQAWAQQYRNSVNNASLTIQGVTYAARTLKMISIVGEEQWHQDFGRWYVVTYQIAVRIKTILGTDGTTIMAQGWDLTVNNVGLRKKVGGVLEEIIDPATNMPVTEPVPLDESTGLPLTLPLAATQRMPLRYFRILAEKDYSVFEFPTV